LLKWKTSRVIRSFVTSLSFFFYFKVLIWDHLFFKISSQSENYTLNIVQQYWYANWFKNICHHY
jgi:hypothetical protein